MNKTRAPKRFLSWRGTIALAGALALFTAWQDGLGAMQGFQEYLAPHAGPPAGWGTLPPQAHLQGALASASGPALSRSLMDEERAALQAMASNRPGDYNAIQIWSAKKFASDMVAIASLALSASGLREVPGAWQAVHVAGRAGGRRAAILRATASTAWNVGGFAARVGSDVFGNRTADLAGRAMTLADIIRGEPTAPTQLGLIVAGDALDPTRPVFTVWADTWRRAWSDPFMSCQGNYRIVIVEGYENPRSAGLASTLSGDIRDGKYFKIVWSSGSTEERYYGSSTVTAGSTSGKANMSSKLPGGIHYGLPPEDQTSSKPPYIQVWPGTWIKNPAYEKQTNDKLQRSDWRNSRSSERPERPRRDLR